VAADRGGARHRTRSGSVGDDGEDGEHHDHHYDRIRSHHDDDNHVDAVSYFVIYGKQPALERDH
jgi:hypothetical protein